MSLSELIDELYSALKTGDKKKGGNSVIIGRYCTAVLLLLVSIGIQMLNIWLIAGLNKKDVFIAVTIVISLFNIFYPPTSIYYWLIFKGFI